MDNYEYICKFIEVNFKFIENGIELVGTSKDGKFRIEISNDNTLLNYNDNLEWLVFKNGILENHYSFKSNKFLEITITEQDNYSVVLAADFINGSKFNAVSNYVYSIDN